MSYQSFKNEAKRVKLSSGRYALVDNEDFEFLNQWKWSFDGRYASRNFYQDGAAFKIYMHTLVFDSKDLDIDHINEDKLDNRKANLRATTRSQNMYNVSKHKSNTSGYKGVYWHKVAKKWMVAVQENGKQKYLGLFNTKSQAIKARKGVQI